MKQILTTMLIVVLFAGTFIARAGDGGKTTKKELQWKSLTDGMTEAKQGKKKVMVDVYTTWCKWCKKLDSDVYGNDRVSDYLSKQYVIVKLNAEANTKVMWKGKSTSEMEFAQSMGVTGYPTILFLDSNGEVINSLGGYVPAEQFIHIIKYLGEDFYKKMSWQDYLKQSGYVPPAAQ